MGLIRPHSRPVGRRSHRGSRQDSLEAFLSLVCHPPHLMNHLERPPWKTHWARHNCRCQPWEDYLNSWKCLEILIYHIIISRHHGVASFLVITGDLEKFQSSGFQFQSHWPLLPASYAPLSPRHPWKNPRRGSCQSLQGPVQSCQLYQGPEKNGIKSQWCFALIGKTFRGDGCAPIEEAAVGMVVDTGVAVGVVESFAELFDDLFEYDMSGIAAGARTFTAKYGQIWYARCAMETVREYLNSVWRLSGNDGRGWRWCNLLLEQFQFNHKFKLNTCSAIALRMAVLESENIW